jgi:hypothetical protein
MVQKVREDTLALERKLGALREDRGGYMHLGSEILLKVIAAHSPRPFSSGQIADDIGLNDTQTKQLTGVFTGFMAPVLKELEKMNHPKVEESKISHFVRYFKELSDHEGLGDRPNIKGTVVYPIIIGEICLWKGEKVFADMLIGALKQAEPNIELKRQIDDIFNLGMKRDDSWMHDHHESNKNTLRVEGK